MRDASRTDRPGEPAGARAPARQSAPRRPAAAAPPRPDRDAGQAPWPPGHDGPRESTRHRDTRIGGAAVAVASAGVAWGLGAPVLEHSTAPVDRDGEVVDDLSRGPLP